MSLARSVSPEVVDQVGQRVTYTFTATNSGDVPLTDVAIVNELDGLSDLTCTPGQPATLKPTETLRCTGTLVSTQATLDFGGLYDVAQVFGEAPDGDPTDPSDDIGAVAAGEVDITQSPALRLALSAKPTAAAAGDTVTYTFDATNRGNVTLTRVAPSAGTFFTAVTCPASRSLAPGASLTCTGTHVVTNAEARTATLTARGLVRAERPFGDPTDTDDDVTARATVAVTLTDAPATPGPSGTPTSTASPSAVPTSTSSASAGPTTTGPTSTSSTSAGPTSAGPTSTGSASANPTSTGSASANPTSTASSSAGATRPAPTTLATATSSVGGVPASGEGPGSLPDTGGPPLALIGLGVLLIAGGTAILMARRRHG